MDIEKYINELTAKALANHSSPTPIDAGEPLEAGPKTDQLVKLWSTSGDRLFLVADQEDARLATERFGPGPRADEVRCIVVVGDPAIVAEIHNWKREFDVEWR